MTPTPDIVVIGAGLAGTRLAARARQLGADVTVLGEERHAPYNRVLLAEVLAGRYGPEVIALPHTPVRRGARVVRIDRAARTVHCADGQITRYGTLVLATGSRPVLPSLPGLPGGGEPGRLPDVVRPFRTLDDCLAIASAVRPGARVAVIGGGLLGVSVASALAGRGAEVVLLHRGERLMERQLDLSASALVREHLAEQGVEVRTGCRVRGVRVPPPGAHASSRTTLRLAPETDPEAAPETTTEKAPGPAAGPSSASDHQPDHQPDHEPTGGRTLDVDLTGGPSLDVDLTVLACGVRPRVGLARSAGLLVHDGIVVDDELRTSDPWIRAIGDCAEHMGRVYALAGPALEQADALARSLTTASPASAPPATASPASASASPPPSAGAHYTGTRALTRLTLAPARTPSVTAHALGTANAPGTAPAPAPRTSTALDLAVFGETTPRPGDDVVQLTDTTRRAHRKVVVRGDRLVGGVLLGDLGAVGALARAWEADEVLPSATAPLHLLTPDGGS
ncbi:FAD-dependent oxidoreductase [Streptomyces sp. GMY02]|uniref:NAD(P)/FAD-dependent oxidoreductase n=1 Tax=Streptomyces sp. GMY02 TaxID=1333528 RepID=UPI001C2BBD91|nr:FAD-dependent oxidoreductase [Streptomyces sp. GMY02]QXE36925.1 FAD-dependent oxidoreductase [Streptomyces sp. GMY02]